MRKGFSGHTVFDDWVKNGGTLVQSPHSKQCLCDTLPNTTSRGKIRCWCLYHILGFFLPLRVWFLSSGALNMCVCLSFFSSAFLTWMSFIELQGTKKLFSSETLTFPWLSQACFLKLNSDPFYFSINYSKCVWRLNDYGSQEFIFNFPPHLPSSYMFPLSSLHPCISEITDFLVSWTMCSIRWTLVFFALSNSFVRSDCFIYRMGPWDKFWTMCTIWTSYMWRTKCVPPPRVSDYRIQAVESSSGK